MRTIARQTRTGARQRRTNAGHTKTSAREKRESAIKKVTRPAQKRAGMEGTVFRGTEREYLCRKRTKTTNGSEAERATTVQATAVVITMPVISYSVPGRTGTSGGERRHKS